VKSDEIEHPRGNTFVVVAGLADGVRDALTRFTRLTV
jgi:hypothetical protein